IPAEYFTMAFSEMDLEEQKEKYRRLLKIFGRHKVSVDICRDIPTESAIKFIIKNSFEIYIPEIQTGLGHRIGCPGKYENCWQKDLCRCIYRN
ncbi:MAG: hypothetical protein ACLFQK_08495, partial [Fibrobacterota bacterium]